MPRAHHKNKETLLEVNPPIIIEEDDTSTSPSLLSSNNWLSHDLKHLMRLPLDVQLNAILGSSDADSFLNPTIKDKKKVCLVDSGINVSKKHDAHELWNNLRLQSQKKLNKKEKDIPYIKHNYKNNLVSEEKLIRKIQFSRHRTELMHRVSQTNRDKTKELLKDFYFPSFEAEFNPLAQTEEYLQQKKPVPSLMIQTEDDLPSSNKGSVICSEKHADKNKHPDSALKIRYLSEEDCTSSGMFRERMMELGIVVNSGISMNKSLHSVNIGSNLVNKEHDSLITTTTPSTCTILINSESSSQCVEQWQPLTMQAIEEHRAPVNSED
eukprot:gene6060-6762_t